MPGESQQQSPEARLERANPRVSRYAMGQFFTPTPIADFMAKAVLEAEPATVLDPGVGGGILLRAVDPGPKRFGCDIDPEAVRLARESLNEQGGELEVVHGDFLDRDGWPFSADDFDAVIANPPYIRHHNLDRRHKALARHYSIVLGTKVSSLSGSYVYFFLEALLRLRAGGRLVFITPAEFLDVGYGAAVKEVLLAHCRLDEVLVLEPDDLAFDGVLTTSAITIATKCRQKTRSFRFGEGTFDGTVRYRAETQIDAATINPRHAWTPLLPSRVARVEPLLAGRTATLADYARVRRGIAAGDNRFFCLTQEEVDHWGIEDEYIAPVVLGAKDLPEPGEALTREFWDGRRRAGAQAWLLTCHKPKDRLRGTRVLRYIEHGEQGGVCERFNCRTRTPWYGVERVPPADFFVTYMSRRRARFVRNQAGARCMSSLLNVWAREGIAADELRPILEDEANASLLREFGRTYGGGLGKIEPAELLRLPVRPLERLAAAA